MVKKEKPTGPFWYTLGPCKPRGVASRRVHLPFALVPRWARLAVHVDSELIVLTVRHVSRQLGGVESNHRHLRIDL